MAFLRQFLINFYLILILKFEIIKKVKNFNY